ncbi:MAG: asparaginase [Rhodospirillales bacterium]|nr:asparaginase [Rhodospirillales bacterium]MDP6884573.1 asparaginase [Rhodospirillales bacterium]
MSTNNPRIAAIGTGGSISAVGRDSLDLFDYGSTGIRVEPQELLDRVPEVATVADVVCVPFRSVSSEAFGPSDWLELNELVHRTAAEDPTLAGMIVIHGTCTLEETAYFLNLTVKVDIPVVLVAAQRSINGLSSDGPLNLVNAVRVAAAPDARGLGVITVLNDEIQAARDVTKVSTHRVNTFRTPDLGILGYADADGRVAVYRRPARRHAPDSEFDLRSIGELPRVDIVYSYGGCDGTAIDAFVAAGARGIVSAAFPPGLPGSGQKAALAEARRLGVHVFITSHGGSGRVLERAALRDAGYVAADNLSPKKARILAMLALTRTDDVAELRRIFQEY